MFRKLKLVVGALMISLSLALVPALVYADSLSDACAGLKLADQQATCDDPAASESQFGNIIRTVINILSIIVGAVAVVMIIIGGFRYVISGGDSSGVSGAKNTILYALVGLVIVLFAQVIVRFVITNVSGPAPGSTTTTTGPDGSTTTTTTNPDGSVTTTTKNPDGSTTTSTTPAPASSEAETTEPAPDGN